MADKPMGMVKMPMLGSFLYFFHSSPTEIALHRGIKKAISIATFHDFSVSAGPAPLETFTTAATAHAIPRAQVSQYGALYPETRAFAGEFFASVCKAVQHRHQAHQAQHNPRCFHDVFV